MTVKWYSFMSMYRKNYLSYIKKYTIEKSYLWKWKLLKATLKSDLSKSILLYYTIKAETVFVEYSKENKYRGISSIKIVWRRKKFKNFDSNNDLKSIWVKYALMDNFGFSSKYYDYILSMNMIIWSNEP